MTEPRHHDVIVVGAGISGLAAAKSAQAVGQRTLVLEARDRVGGRLLTERGAGTPLDLGASWIHGPKRNPIAELLRDEGAVLRKTNFDSITLYRNGRRIDESEIDELQAFYSYVEECKKRAVKDEPLSVAFDSYVALKGASRIEQEVFDHDVRLCIETEFGGSIDSLSLMQFNEDEEFEGGDLFVASGYDALARKLSLDLNIRLNSLVLAIRDIGSRVLVSGQDFSFTADRVVVTVPLGVLQKGSIDFSPSLSGRKIEAIASLAMGNLHKTFLEFDRQFWDPTQVIGFVHNGTSWGEFINLTEETGKPLLLALHAGAKASQLALMSTTEIADEAFLTLRSAYPNATRPVRLTTSAWEHDTYSFGSYCYIPVGASLKMCDELSKPHGRVFFAGEHTSSSYPGTVHGAYLSGARAARALLRR
jgi:monoamine oxidase